MKKLKKGMYVKYIRTMAHDTILRIAKIKEEKKHLLTLDNGYVIADTDVIDAGVEIIDLVEHMDLIEIENPIKLYDKNEVSLFNPVRCDGFTEFEDGTLCIILNADYLVNIKDLKIKSVLTREQFNNEKYVVNEVE